MTPSNPSAHRPSRRALLAGASGVGLSAALAPSASGLHEASRAIFAEPTSSLHPSMSTKTAVHSLPPLPYAESALEPMMSAKTFSFHYGKHHKAYVDNLNKLLEAEPELAALELEALVQKVAGQSAKAAIFNNAAQVYNHTFFWNSMRPSGGGKPSGALLQKLEASFGDFEKFKSAFAEAAKTQFGSGWAWLIEDGGKLAVAKSSNADTPMAQNKRCLLALDVWEHAYYLDYQNRRPDYVTTFLDKLVNWEFAAQNLG